MTHTLATLPHEILPLLRMEQGLHIGAVAEKLYVANSVIENLESGCYSELYGNAYIFGLIRSYAALLEADPDSMIAAYKLYSAESGRDACPDRLSKLLSAARKHSVNGALVSFAIFLIFFSYVSYQKKHVPAVEVGSAIAIDTAVGKTIVSSVDEMPVVNPTQSLLLTTHVDVEKEDVSSSQVSEIKSSGSTIESGKSTLSFSFTADCWVVILDGDNKLIHSALQHAENRLDLSGKPPFKITLGYASAVAIIYNDKPVVISADEANTARLVLGNS
jgi:cytoskeleton protein RodZ